MHNRFTNHLKARGETNKMGFLLDDPEQWDDVAEIPDDFGQKVISAFNSGLKLNDLRKTTSPDQVWMLEFLAMYHQSYA